LILITSNSHDHLTWPPFAQSNATFAVDHVVMEHMSYS